MKCINNHAANYVYPTSWTSTSNIGIIDKALSKEIWPWLAVMASWNVVPYYVTHMPLLRAQPPYKGGLPQPPEHGGIPPIVTKEVSDPDMLILFMSYYRLY